MCVPWLSNYKNPHPIWDLVICCTVHLYLPFCNLSHLGFFNANPRIRLNALKRGKISLKPAIPPRQPMPSLKELEVLLVEFSQPRLDYPAHVLPNCLVDIQRPVVKIMPKTGTVSHFWNRSCAKESNMLWHVHSANLAKCLFQIHPISLAGSSWLIANHSSPCSAIMSKISPATYVR